jgi:trigger factor
MQAGNVPLLVSEVVRAKALALVVEAAEVRDSSGNVVELKELQPDGTIAESEPEQDEVPEDAEVAGEAGRA